MLNKYLGTVQKTYNNLWTILSDLTGLEARTNERIAKAHRGKVPHYVNSGAQKKLDKKRKGLSRVCSNYSRQTAQTFAREVKSVYNEYFVD